MGGIVNDNLNCKSYLTLDKQFIINAHAHDCIYIDHHTCLQMCFVCILQYMYQRLLSPRLLLPH